MIPAAPGIPADRTVRALIIALLDMPLDAEIEVDHPEVPGVNSIVRVSQVPNVFYGQQYVRLETVDA